MSIVYRIIFFGPRICILYLFWVGVKGGSSITLFSGSIFVYPIIQQEPDSELVQGNFGN